MSETKETDNKSGSGDDSGKSVTLSLKRTVDAGHVRQNFSHGRSKSVLVEKKKRRAIAAPATGRATAAPTGAVIIETKKRPGKAGAKKPITDHTSAPAGDKDGNLVRKLSDEEKDARLRALAAAREREQEEKLRAEEEQQRRRANGC